MQKFNYNKLRGRIVEIYGANLNFAAAMGITNKTLSLKMNGKARWTQPEIVTACELLRIDLVDIPEYFFAVEC
jgi:hypothetical protein